MTVKMRRLALAASSVQQEWKKKHVKESPVLSLGRISKSHALRGILAAQRPQ